MNLYELAHHPDAFKQKRIGESAKDNFWWGNDQISTQTQFDLMNHECRHGEYPSEHKNPHEFRMHLLFVHWATLPTNEYFYPPDMSSICLNAIVEKETS